MTEPISRPDAEGPPVQEESGARVKEAAASPVPDDVAVLTDAGRSGIIQITETGLLLSFDYFGSLYTTAQLSDSEAALEIIARLRESNETPESCFPRLLTVEALFVLRLIWLSSSFVSDTVREIVGLQSGVVVSGVKPVTRRKLGQELGRRLGAVQYPFTDGAVPRGQPRPLPRPTTDCCIRIASRVVDVAMIYGFVEPDPGRKSTKNFKPISATEDLDRLMTTFAYRGAELMRNMLASSDEQD